MTFLAGAFAEVFAGVFGAAAFGAGGVVVTPSATCRTAILLTAPLLPALAGVFFLVGVNACANELTAAATTRTRIRSRGFPCKVLFLL